ncbi:MAG: hypothetical protein HQ567_13800 [Candidatus Nealsonbacteria bacterium]|nr:hypothetical protein [Candidatus Nealsonbacteria bacterium]
MAKDGLENPNLSGMLKAVASEGLTLEDQKATVEFLNALPGNPPVRIPLSARYGSSTLHHQRRPETAALATEAL